MGWLPAAAASLGVFFIMARSVVAPVVAAPDRLEYLFLAPARHEIALLAAAAIALTLALRIYLPAKRLRPLCLLALAAAPLVAFIPGLERAGAPFVFIGRDMQGWLLVLALLFFAREVNEAAGGRLVARLRWPASWPPAMRLLAWDAAIFAFVAVWAIYTQPFMRFASQPHGDEPKYLRYAENWYQGQGFDLQGKTLMSDMRLDAPSHVWRNVALAAGAARSDAVSLARDVASFARQPRAFQWNRARGGDGWFIRGKDGGLYQTHTPGLAAVIFPGYYIDRHLLDLDSGHQGEIPGGLYVTNITLLLVYAIWAVVMFRLLRRLFDDERFAAMLAVLAMITLPVTSFAFQLYPETVAGAALSGVLVFLLFPRSEASVKRAFAFGLLCGFLPWAHIRFALVSLVAAGFSLLPRTGEWRQRRAFLAGYAAMLALLCVYAYRLTGSALPTAMYGAPGAPESFDSAVLAPNFTGYMVDRIWGILPHAPVLLLAFAGLGPLWRASRAHALLFAGIVLSLAMPAAAHSLNAAGATPGRHLVAIIPLAMWPLGLAIRAWWSSRAFRAAFATLTLLSLQAALAYNWWHTKDMGRMWDASISGWKVNLLFAWTHGQVWAESRGNFVLFLIGAAVIVGLIVLGSRLAAPKPKAKAGVTPSMLAIGLLLTAIAGAGASTLTGDAFRDDYTQHPLVSRRDALTRLAEISDCTLCAASGRGEVNAATMIWNSVEQFDVFVEPVGGLAAELRLVLNAKDKEPAFGHVRIEFGDGSFSSSVPVAGLRRLRHVYRAPGTYTVRAFLTMPDETRRDTYTEVVVR